MSGEGVHGVVVNTRRSMLCMFSSVKNGGSPALVMRVGVTVSRSSGHCSRHCACFAQLLRAAARAALRAALDIACRPPVACEGYLLWLQWTGCPVLCAVSVTKSSINSSGNLASPQEGWGVLQAARQGPGGIHGSPRRAGSGGPYGPQQ